MPALFERFCALPIDHACIGLAKGESSGGYYCTPVGAQVLGWEGCIHYCTIDGFGEAVFAVNPESCAASEVYPLARSFADLLRLILAAGGTTAVEQIAWMTREQYEAFLSTEEERRNRERPDVHAALEMLSARLGLAPMPDAYGYVKQLQQELAGACIPFADEYYEVKGIKP